MSKNTNEKNDLRFVSRNLPSRNEAHGIKSRHSHRKKKVNEPVKADTPNQSTDHSIKRDQQLKQPKPLPQTEESVKQPPQPPVTSTHPVNDATKNIELKKETTVANKKKTGSNKTTEKEVKLSTMIVKEVFSWILTFVLAIGLYFVISTFVAQKYQVSGSSMYPTLQNNEEVIGNKLEKIDRLDIVVFKAPDTGREYVKRVIGLPGDSVTYLDGKLFVNDQQIEEPFINQEETFEINGQKTLGTSSFTLPQLTGEMVVPDGHYFVMGDNRGHSNDSRSFGFVKRESIHAVVRAIVWPYNKWEFFKTIPSP
ncbi:signal peptidase I [Atopobacter phocae]|uniref:signal peptidase I n=1 Tax=Atopobacter phocae TaxID=136492 RepID=UPI00046F3874|nr:signal peptidase I [Atopobacter phocae]